MPLWHAVEVSIGNYNDLEWRQRILEVFSLNIKDEVEYKKWQTKKQNEVKMKKTDKEILLQIFKKTDMEICYEEKDYFEVELSSDSIGFQFDADGNLRELL